MRDIEKDHTLDVTKLVKRLPAGKIGQFEPISGVIINIDKASFRELVIRWKATESTESDIIFLDTINHETHHFVQTTSSGYMFDRARRLFSVFNTEDRRILDELDALEDEALEYWAHLLKESGIDEILDKETEDLRRIKNIAAVTYNFGRTQLFSKYGREDDHSIAGALMPNFFNFHQELHDSETIQNNAGLSILGLIEGAAVIYCALFTGTSVQAIAKIETQILSLPPLYRELWVLTTTKAGKRALEIALPLCAVALCYERPNDAYVALLPKLLESPETIAPDVARKLFEDLPEIPDAGMKLGTGWELRAKDDSYRVYDSTFQAWQNDPSEPAPFDLLTNPSVVSNLQAMPACMTLSDDYVGATLPASEVGARIVLASMVLQVSSRRREQKDFEKFSTNWARSVIDRNFFPK